MAERMAGRPLSAEEAALWARVVAGVRPSRRQGGAGSAPIAPPRVAKAPVPARENRPLPQPGAGPPGRPRPVASNTLDARWDRDLRKGTAPVDVVIDLHGFTLQAAFAHLDTALSEACARGDRLVLLVTGNPPRPGCDRPAARGAIRAAAGDWLARSRHAGSIAAIRAAHPRHGGGGALYLVLRRRR